MYGNSMIPKSPLPMGITKNFINRPLWESDAGAGQAWNHGTPASSAQLAEHGGGGAGRAAGAHLVLIVEE